MIQRRGNFGDLKENFTKNWLDYKLGFGDLNGEFWFGNDYISRLTHETPMRLRIELAAHNGSKAWAEYDTFRYSLVGTLKIQFDLALFAGWKEKIWISGYGSEAIQAMPRIA